jgi:hypothetical protein
MMRRVTIATTVAISLFSSAAFTQNPSQAQQSIPDFSGVWTKPYIGVGPPLSGPGPVRYRSRAIALGDYTNPILKPEAAEVVKKHVKLSWEGSPLRTRATSVGRKGYHSFLGTLECKCCNSLIELQFFMIMIMRSAVCG